MAQPADRDLPAATGRANARIALKAVALAAVLIGGGIFLREVAPATLRSLHPDTAGAVWLVALGGVALAAGLPRQVLAFAGGYVFGAIPGIILSLAGQMLACWLDYYAARGVGESWARRRLQGAGAWRLLRVLLDRPFNATLMFRLLPIGNNLLLNLAAGVAGIPAARFFAASAVGYLPQTLVFALLGSGVQVGRPAQLATGAALLVVSVGLGLLLLRQSRRGDTAA